MMEDDEYEYEHLTPNAHNQLALYTPPSERFSAILEPPKSLLLRSGLEVELKAGGKGTGSTSWQAATKLAQILTLDPTLECVRRLQWPGQFEEPLLLHQKNSEGLQGLNVIELGAGLGLVSVAAALQGANVIATDGEPELIPILQHNLDSNITKHCRLPAQQQQGGPRTRAEEAGLSNKPGGGRSAVAPPRARAAVLDWADEAGAAALEAEAGGAFHLVLAADVVYGHTPAHARAAAALARLLRRLAGGPRGLALLAHTERYPEREAAVFWRRVDRAFLRQRVAWPLPSAPPCRSSFSGVGQQGGGDKRREGPSANTTSSQCHDVPAPADDGDDSNSKVSSKNNHRSILQHSSSPRSLPPPPSAPVHRWHTEEEEGKKERVKLWALRPWPNNAAKRVAPANAQNTCTTTPQK